MSGQKITVYIKDDTERCVIKEALRRHRNNIEAMKDTTLSYAQEQMREDILNAITDLKNSIANITSIAQGPQKPQEQHPFVGPDPQAWLYDE